MPFTKITIKKITENKTKLTTKNRRSASSSTNVSQA